MQFNLPAKTVLKSAPVFFVQSIFWACFQLLIGKSHAFDSSWCAWCR